MAEVVFRPATVDDTGYVVDCMRRGLRGSALLGGVSTAALTLMIESLLSTCEVTIACLDTDKLGIVGFAVHRDNNVLAWVHFRTGLNGYRDILLRRLFPDMTSNGESLVSPLPPWLACPALASVRWQPYLTAQWAYGE